MTDELTDSGKKERLAGRKILITGASAGIGAALAVEAARHGAVVGLTGRDQARLDEVRNQCVAWSPNSLAWDALGGVDVLVNNAAMPKRRHVRDLTSQEVEQVMQVNFFSPVRLIMALLPHMLDRDYGVIVNVGSVAGRAGGAHEAAYSASKFALAGWTESMAIDLWTTGVEIHLVNPGPIDTNIWDRPGNDAPMITPPTLYPPISVADTIISAIGARTFEYFSPAEYGDRILAKSANVGRYVGAMGKRTS
jgi:short-subunit dehydrogenase